MALRTAHGTARAGGASVVVEVPPADELRPFQAQGQTQPSAPFGGRRNAFKRGSEQAKRAGAKGGASRANKAALRAQLSKLGLGDLATAPEFTTYITEAEDFRSAQAAELAELAGGMCGVGPSSMVATAALQLAGSRYLFVIAGREKDAELAVKIFARAASLGDSSRQNILAAYHLAELQARSRGRHKPGSSAAEAASRAMAQLEAKRAAEERRGE